MKVGPPKHCCPTKVLAAFRVPHESPDVAHVESHAVSFASRRPRPRIPVAMCIQLGPSEKSRSGSASDGRSRSIGTRGTRSASRPRPPLLVSPAPLRGQATKGSRMGNNLWRESLVYL